MVIKEVSLRHIDLLDETFRISEDLDPPAMRSSIEAVGQLSPVVLLQRENGFGIVCGFRRVRALRILGCDHAVARILERTDAPLLDSFKSRASPAHSYRNPDGKSFLMIAAA